MCHDHRPRLQFPTGNTTTRLETPPPDWKHQQTGNMTDMTEYYQQISEIKKAIRERELQRLELERETLTKAHKRERRHEELKQKLKGLHQELVREEVQATQRVQNLMAQVESVKKEHQRLAIRTERLREKKRQYELHFVTASAELHIPPPQNIHGNSFNAGAADPVRSDLAFSISAPVRPATTLYNTMSPTTSSLPAASALYPSREQPKRMQTVEQIWMQQDKSQPLQIPGKEINSEAHLPQETDYSDPLLKPIGNINSSHPNITVRQDFLPNQQYISSQSNLSHYQHGAPDINQASRESVNIQPYAEPIPSLARKDSVGSQVSSKYEEPAVTRLPTTVGQESLDKNRGSVLPQKYADANIPQAESASKNDNNAEMSRYLGGSHPSQEQVNDTMVHPPQNNGSISKSEKTKYNMDRGNQPHFREKVNEMNNQRSLLPEKPEEIMPATQGTSFTSNTIPHTVNRTSANIVSDVHSSPEKDAPSISSQYSTSTLRENSPAMKKYTDDYSPVQTDSAESNPKVNTVTPQNMKVSEEVTSYSSGSQNMVERQMDILEGSVSANEVSHNEKPVHPAEQVRKYSQETIQPRESVSPPAEDDSDFYGHTSPITASAAYQQMAKGGVDVGTESESEGVEDVLAPPSLARKMPPRPSYKTFASSIPSLRPGPGGTDTDSVDSVEAAIQAAMKGKNKEEKTTSNGPDVNESRVGGGATSEGVKKSAMEAGEETEMRAEKKMGKSKVEEHKKSRPPAALHLTLESDEESCAVSAGAEASDEDDFDFYDKF
ncbi:hypothetical protein Pmani_036808 [Petrolisthes manimaculis]|uniref:Uncharacterized protein n=1 Tax=Petrolisthes manimaculis TaxID=1843537 RepID=A0AAE1NI27_9EUCA|nr:hypothetical protein Pmani_036808 [Petrolisthes manimaculis]